MDARLSEAMTFEITAAVPNNPIVREVDQARQRELWRWVLIGFVLLAAALFDGWQRFGIIAHGYRLEQLQRERAAEEAVSRHLRLEIETLRSPLRIESLALNRLRLVAPAPGDATVIERIVPAEQPPSSVVAVR